MSHATIRRLFTARRSPPLTANDFLRGTGRRILTARRSVPVISDGLMLAAAASFARQAPRAAAAALATPLPCTKSPLPPAVAVSARQPPHAGPPVNLLAAVLPLPPPSPSLPCRPVAAVPPPYVCFYHERFGTAARHCCPPCSWLVSQGHLPPLGAQLAGGHLILLRDSISSQDFLVDSGSSYSLLPHQSSAPPSGPLLHTADGTPLPTWGIRETSVRFGSHPFLFSFLLVPVSLPILGADILAAHHLLVDAHPRQVLLSSSLQPLHPADSSPLLASLQACPSQLRSPLTSYPTVFSSEISSSRPVLLSRSNFDPAPVPANGSGSG